MMTLLGDMLGDDAEKASLFKQASKMYKTGAVTAAQFMRALVKLLGPGNARRVIPVVADAVEVEDRHGGVSSLTPPPHDPPPHSSR